MNVYAFVENRFRGVDYLGLWVWSPESISYINIAFDPAMRVDTHGPPVAYRRGTTAAALYARSLGGLNHTLFQHYLTGGGRDYDLTGSLLIRGEVEAALAAFMQREHSDIIRDAESFNCPGGGGIFGLSIHSIGDDEYSDLRIQGFTSSVWVIGRARAGVRKKTNAFILCCNETALGALVMSSFRMYLHDQFADAADPRHRTPGAQEFRGGTQFHETGAWGRIVSQIGVNR